MLKKYILPTLILLFFIPSSVYAVDFSIPDVKIDAYLQEDGDVNVKERHTYTFDGKFNGITREIFPKKGAEISDLMAKEKEKSLKVEKEEELYKIHRSGKDETIQIDIHYTIKNGLGKYTDVTEFYWPFFDNRNEADYGKMTIAIHPPQSTDDAIALGYESAFKKESVADDGTVTFSIGEVAAGENGDIRVAYDSALFPAMSLTRDKEMKEEIVSEKRMMEENAILYKKNKNKMASIVIWVLAGFTVLFVVMAVNEFSKSKRQRKNILDDVFNQKLKVPEQQMSIPATILFTDVFHNSTIAAGLMDLVRQGYVEQTKKGDFQLISREAKEEHERILISFLFDKIGWDGKFCMDNLETFMGNKKNHIDYTNESNRWITAVTNETKEAGLYDQRKTVRVTAGLLSLFPFCFIIFSAKYDLFLYMTLFIVLFMLYLGFAFFYKPLSAKGIRMQIEWGRLVNEFDRISDWDWQLYNDDDRMRAMIYSLGIGDSMTAKLNRNTTFDQSASFYPMNWLALSSSFDAAGEQATDTASSQSTGSSSSVGGGVGGGGGGSGAF